MSLSRFFRPAHEVAKALKHQGLLSKRDPWATLTSLGFEPLHERELNKMMNWSHNQLSQISPSIDVVEVNQPRECFIQALQRYRLVSG